MDRRIVINGKWTTASRMTGVQRYAADLHGAMERAGMPHVLLTPGIGRLAGRTLWEQAVLPASLRPGDTLFCPANTAPLALRRSIRLVVTLHCLRYLSHPSHYRPGFVRWYRFAIPRILSRADAVVTVSHAVADEISSRFPGCSSRLSVIPPGVHRRFSPERRRDDTSSLELPATGPYWVFLGEPTEAKNLSAILHADAHVSGQHNVFLAGSDNAQLTAALARHPQLQRIKVHALGQINAPDQVAALLRGAQGLLAPSRYESFGLPVLEAMACGTPVIASDLAAHREVAQDAAVYCNPDDHAGWASHMDRLADDPDERTKLTDRGVARAGGFSWDTSAQRVWSLLHA